MRFDPDVVRLLAAFAEQRRKPLSEQTVAEARENYLISGRANGLPPVQIASVTAVSATLADRQIPLRCYRPDGVPSDNAPAIVFFHGGGWVIGDLESHDRVCRHLADAAKTTVIAVDYRLAPEHPFPAAAEDAIDAYRWIAAHAPTLGIDATQLAVAGDSAGGNLAAVVALAVRGEPMAPVAQLLFYPVTDLGAESAGYQRVTEGLTLIADTMRWFTARYLPDASQGLDWRASPIRAETLQGLPPAFVVSAGFDPLCEEAVAFARLLDEADVRVNHLHLADQMHGFLTLGGKIGAASMVLDTAAAFAKRIFAAH